MSIIGQAYKIHTLITAPKIHADLLWDLSILFIGLTVLYFIGVFYFRNKISANAQKVKQRKNELSPMISEFLFFEDDSSKSEKSNYLKLKIEIRQLLKDDFNRKVLIEILLDLRKDVSGETQARLFKLFKGLGLHNDAYAKLESMRWEVISKGISELTQMQVDEAYSFITKFINDKRGTIRKQAEIATVTLKHEGINYFLDTTKYKISEWQQLKLLDVIRNFDDFQPPRFKAWLTSKNAHVVLFALRLIKYYSQNDAYASIIELVKHRNNQIKLEAIKCIKEFNIVDALETLKKVFWRCSIDIKISILDVIGTIGNESEILFLQLIDNKEVNFSVKSKALSSINMILPDSILPTVGLEDISGFKIPKNIVPEIPIKAEIDFNDLKEETSVSEIPVTVPMAPINILAKSAYAELEVEFEEVTPIKNIPEIEISNHTIVSGKKQSDSLDLINLDFLPIVTHEDITEYVLKKTENEVSQEMRSKREDILGIKIQFEEIFPETKKMATEELNVIASTRNDCMDSNELNFLPFIVGNDVNSEVSTLHPNRYKYNTGNVYDANNSEILDFQIVYEELGLAPEQVLEDIHTVNLPNFLSNLLNQNEQVKTSYKPTSVKNIDLKLLYNQVVIYEEVDLSNEQFAHSEDSINWPLGMDETNSDEKLHLEDIEASQTKYESEDQLNEHLLSELLKPNFINEATQDLSQVLDDLEEMGDEREIPLLLEYLEQESNTDIKVRIRALVKKFAQWQPKTEKSSENSDNKIDLPEYSVVKELFDTCDLESKIILLDSIVDVMDEKDIDFLQGLLEHPEKIIQKKAKRGLESLTVRLNMIKDSSNNEIGGFRNSGFLNLSEDGEIHKSGAISINDAPISEHEIVYDLLEMLEYEDLQEANLVQNSSECLILAQLKSISNKVLKKLNG